MKIKKETWPLNTSHSYKAVINTQPDYQRDLVWTTAQKQLLIDTILRGYDIPKLYFREYEKDDYQYQVIDGQQRLNAIWDFMDEKYSLPKNAEPVDGIEIAGKKFSQLDIKLNMKWQRYTLDIVILEESTEDDAMNLFLRLQNGTNLKAQEKRNAMPGRMKEFVLDVSNHDFFKNSVHFKNTRNSYDLTAAQMVLLTITNGIRNVRDKDLTQMYKDEISFNKESPVAKKVFRILNYLYKMFPNNTPELEKYNVISLYIIIMKLIDDYAISKREAEIANWFFDFEKRRSADLQLDPDERSGKFVMYSEKISNGTDALDSLTYRDNLLTEDLFSFIPDLVRKDPQRSFDFSQRLAIFRKDDGTCQICKKQCTFDNFEADHITPWSLGGPTTVANGQVLCPHCNEAKGNNI